MDKESIKQEAQAALSWCLKQGKLEQKEVQLAMKDKEAFKKLAAKALAIYRKNMEKYQSMTDEEIPAPKWRCGTPFARKWEEEAMKKEGQKDTSKE